jgi:ribosomal protein S12 methylthiotransferase accessory factor YcaO
VREDARAVKPIAPGRLRSLWKPAGGNIASFGDIPTYENDDILSDVRLMIQRLRDAGITQAYAIDLSDKDFPASVARVVVPELESWVLSDFSPQECRLGRRAARYLRSHAPQVPSVRKEDANAF